MGLVTCDSGRAISAAAAVHYLMHRSGSTVTKDQAITNVQCCKTDIFTMTGSAATVSTLTSVYPSAIHNHLPHQTTNKQKNSFQLRRSGLVSTSTPPRDIVH